jgi:hypothetical protein
MSQPLGREVGTALPGLVASLLSWGVTDAHWLPGPAGAPVLWLETATEAQRHLLEGQPWLATQVRMLLMRHGVPPEAVAGVAVMLDSAQSQATLLGDA